MSIVPGWYLLFDECEIMRGIAMLFPLLKGWYLDPFNTTLSGHLHSQYVPVAQNMMQLK